MVWEYSVLEREVKDNNSVHTDNRVDSCKGRGGEDAWWTAGTHEVLLPVSTTLANQIRYYKPWHNLTESN